MEEVQGQTPIQEQTEPQSAPDSRSDTTIEARDEGNPEARPEGEAAPAREAPEAEPPAQEERPETEERRSEPREGREERAVRFRQAAYDILRGWVEEGERLQGLYPDFRLAKEAEDPAFRSLLKGGVSVQAAYEALHPEALEARLAEQLRRRDAAARARDLARPSEGALHARRPITTRPDLASLSRSQREDVARRVMKGERIEG